MDKYVCGPCGYVYDPAEGDPDNDIAPALVFLAGNGARFITGQTIALDGGHTMLGS